MTVLVIVLVVLLAAASAAIAWLLAGRRAAPPVPPPGPLLPPAAPGPSLDEVQRRYAAAAVTRADGNQSEAARSLGVSRNTLRRKVLGES